MKISHLQVWHPQCHNSMTMESSLTTRDSGVSVQDLGQPTILLHQLTCNQWTSGDYQQDHQGYLKKEAGEKEKSMAR